jgi:hypothetical protein
LPADSPTRQRAEILKKAAKHYQIKTPPGSMHGLRKEDKFADSYAASPTVGMETENKSKATKLVDIMKKRKLITLTLHPPLLLVPLVPSVP